MKGERHCVVYVHVHHIPHKICVTYLYTTTGILFQDLKEATLSSSLSVIHTGTSSF